jgi:hypothetical protein
MMITIQLPNILLYTTAYDFIICDRIKFDACRKHYNHRNSIFFLSLVEKTTLYISQILNNYILPTSYSGLAFIEHVSILPEEKRSFGRPGCR